MAHALLLEITLFEEEKIPHFLDSLKIIKLITQLTSHFWMIEQEHVQLNRVPTHSGSFLRNRHFREILERTKGQLISKCLFGVFNSPKKRTKTIRLEVP